MTRWVTLAVLIVALSAAATVAVQYLPADSPETRAPAVEADGAAPAVVITPKSLRHDFGTMAQESTGTHEWVVKNEGDADLKLYVLRSTCTCTFANLGKEEHELVLKPGQKWPIKLEWNTKENTGTFEQSATVSTNDPARPEVEFKAVGFVQPPIVMLPTSDTGLNFQTVSNADGGKTVKAIFSPDHPDLTLSWTSSNPDLVGLEIKPLTPEEVKGFGLKTKGFKAEFVVKPTRRIGPFAEEVTVSTGHPKKPEVMFRVHGQLVGPISTAPTMISLKGVAGARGAAAPVTVWVTGQEETHFTVKDSPKGLQVTFTPVDEKTKGTSGSEKKGRHYRMTVKLPPGTPPGRIAGPIVVTTDHPQVSEFVVPFDALVGDEE